MKKNYFIYGCCFLWVFLSSVAEAAVNNTGLTCETALAAQTGTNSSSQAPQWFKYTMPQNGNITVSSVGLTTQDTYLEIYNACGGELLGRNDEYGISSQSQIQLFGLSAGQELYIYWADDYDSGAFNWSLAVEDTQPGDFCGLPIQAAEGTNSASKAPQWFKYTMPKNGNITVSSVGLTTTEDTYLEIYDACGGELLGRNDDDGSRQSHLKLFGLSAGQELYIYWADDYDSGAFNWSLAVEDTQPGDLCNVAVQATEGTNTASRAPQWFKFTMPSDGKVTISSVGLTTEDTYLYVYDACEGGLLGSNDDFGGSSQSQRILTGLSAGQELYINWAYNSSSVAFDWSLLVEDTQPGDLCDIAVQATEGTNSASRAPQWFKFTMPSDGKVTISSVGLTTEDTYLYVYDACGGGLLGSNDSYGDFEQSQLTIFELSTGQDLYIYWADDYNSGAFNWSLTVEDLQPGDLCSLPIQATEGANSTSSAPQWFSFTMPQAGDITISSVGFADEVDPQDTYLRIYDACGGNLLSSNDDFNRTRQSQITLTDIAEGQEFIILWDDVYDVGGFNWNLALNIYGLRRQTISFLAIEDQPLSGNSIPLAATASSGLAVSYSVTGPASISGNELVFEGPGSVTIVAAQSGDDVYEAAENVTNTFCIKPDKPTISVVGGGVAAIGSTLESSSAEGYQWYKNDVAIENATAATYLIEENAAYSVMVTGGTCTSFRSESLNMAITGIEDGVGQSLVIYPNPTAGPLNVELKNSGEVSVSIFDLSGRKVSEITAVKVVQNGKRLAQMDISSLSAGLYYVLVKNGNEIIQAKVYKK